MIIKRDKDKDPFDRFGNWDFEDIFEEFDEKFRRMQYFMNKSLKEALETGSFESEEMKPYIYGWSLKVGPDGKPQFREFGNTPSKQGLFKEAREPLVDVIEGDDMICVTIELPGVEKENIDLEVTPLILKINVDAKDRKYYKEVKFSTDVDTTSARATYQNGVLDVEVKKKQFDKKGNKINIE